MTCRCHHTRGLERQSGHTGLCVLCTNRERHGGRIARAKAANAEDCAARGVTSERWRWVNWREI